MHKYIIKRFLVTFIALFPGIWCLSEIICIANKTATSRGLTMSFLVSFGIAWLMSTLITSLTGDFDD